MDQAENLRSIVAQQRLAHPPLRVLAVTSGKGGVGKTNLSANLAVEAARAGRRVLLIDADLGLANVEILYGLQPRLHLGHLLDGSVRAPDVLVEGPGGVRLLPASSGVQALTELDDAQKLRLVSAMDPLADAYDLVLIDCGAGIGNNVLFFVAAAQEALLVVSPEPTSLTDAYAAVKVLSQQAGVRQFNVVINPAATDAIAREIFERLTQVTNRFLSARVSYLGHVPRDENLGRAVMAQSPVVELFPHSPASVAIRQLAGSLLDAPSAPTLDGGMKVFWERLLRDSRTQVD